MLIEETKTRTISLSDIDIKEAIIMYLKARGEREIGRNDIKLDPVKVEARIVITETSKPEQQPSKIEEINKQ
jgi:hypothetical protein